MPGRLKPAFLVVTNTDAGNEKNRRPQLRARADGPACATRASSGTPTAQLRLDDRLERLKTIRFHKKLGSYFEKAQRVEKLARWIATEPLASPRRGRCRRDGRPARQGRPRHRDGGRADRAAGRDGRHLRARRRAARARSGRRSTTTTCPTRSRPMRRRRASSSATRRSRGRPCRWPTSSTRSSACSTPARSRPARAIRSGCGARRTASSRSSSICRRSTGLAARPLARHAARRGGRAVCARSRSGRPSIARRWTRSCSIGTAMSSSSADSTCATSRRCCRRPVRHVSPADALKRLEVLPEFTARPISRSWRSPSSASRTSRASCRTPIRCARRRSRRSRRCSRNRRKSRCCRSSTSAAR